MSNHNKNRVPIHPLSYRGEALQGEMNEYWGHRHNPEALLKRFDDDIKEHTIFMAENGVNPRKNPIQVGATIVGLVATPRYNPNRPSRYNGTKIIIAEGYNMSPYLGAEKDCAELRALRMGDEEVIKNINKGLYRLLHDPLRGLMAWKAMYAQIASNGVATNLEINGIEADTLHCCMTPCQPTLMQHSATSPDMPIGLLTYSPGTREIINEEQYTLDSMTSMYQGVEPPAVSRDLIQKRK